jgi:hypothetical protein
MGDKSPKNKNKNQQQKQAVKTSDKQNKAAQVAAKSVLNKKK